MDLDRFSTDTPTDDAPADARVCVVATQQATFKRCRDGLYPSPASYDRTNEPFEYMAFYRTAPISAVTHYARVTGRETQARGEAGPLDETDWEQLIDPFSAERQVVVFELGAVVPLAEPVDNDDTGVRGAWYCTIGDLRAAETVSALADRAAT